jgi:hypothetical protein
MLVRAATLADFQALDGPGQSGVGDRGERCASRSEPYSSPSVSAAPPIPASTATTLTALRVSRTCRRASTESRGWARFVSAVRSQAALKGSSIFSTQTLRVDFQGLMNAR